MTNRRKFTLEFEAQVVLDAHSTKSAAQVSREYGIKDSVLYRWKQEFKERSLILFEQGAARDDRDEQIAELERVVGLMAMEVDMIKKVSRLLNSPRSRNERW
jgi:transposase